jgi:nucleotide-binding universal stress UspA family protein
LIVRGRPDPEGPVAVGVDGSERSSQALEFAAGAAQRRGVPLVVVHVWRMPVPPFPGTAIPMVYDVGMLETEGRRRLEAAVAGVADRYPGLQVQTELDRGATTAVLASWSREAQLMVVGDRGHGGFVGLLLGSVSQHLIYHSACPVAVVRDERR